MAKQKLSRRELDYQSALRSATRGFWSGEYSLFQFFDNMTRAIERNFRLAWEEGLRDCGINPNETTAEEDARLRLEINTEIGYLYGFANDVYNANRASGGLLRDLNRRLGMWVNKYGMIRNLARTYACEDRKKKWVMNPRKEHCESCLRLDGRVYRASTWQRYNIYPRMPRLRCGGFWCGCDFEDTDEPCTPGRPPEI